MGKVLERIETQRARAHIDTTQALRTALRHGRTLLAWLEESGATRYEPTREQDLDNMLTALDVLSANLHYYRHARDAVRMAEELTAEVIAERSVIETPKTAYRASTDTQITAGSSAIPATSDMIEIPITDERGNKRVYRQRVSTVQQDVSEQEKPAESPVPGARSEGKHAARSRPASVLPAASAPSGQCSVCKRYTFSAHLNGTRCNAQRRNGAHAGQCSGIFVALNRDIATGRRFPVHIGKAKYSVPISLGTRAYSMYAASFADPSPYTEIVKRGGFSADEMDCLLNCGRLHTEQHTESERTVLRHAWIRSAEPVE